MIERISTPRNTKAIIDKYAFAFQKRYGQNFLIDQNVIDKILQGAEVSSEDIVIEIGPGIGSLTQYLCEHAKKVIAIEIDKKLIPILEDTLESYNNLELINQDILTVDLNELLSPYQGQSIKIIANLPYYITTPIIMYIFEEHVPIHSITIMIQKEVAERIHAKPNSKIYGALTLAVQYYSETHIIAHVPPNCFVPRPTVGSAVIRLTAHQDTKMKVTNEKALFHIIRSAFNQRRKTLINTLANHMSLDKESVALILEEMGIVRTIRGEALSLEQFGELTNRLYEAELLK